MRTGPGAKRDGAQHLIRGSAIEEWQVPPDFRLRMSEKIGEGIQRHARHFQLAIVEADIYHATDPVSRPSASASGTSTNVPGQEQTTESDGV